jgi:hydroxymethylbilane synthase
MTGSTSRGGRPLRLGTRGSALALAQAAVVVGRLRSWYPELCWETVVIRTEGDADKVSPLTEIGGRGVFTNALQDALLRGDIDAAVHSAKDLPTALHPDAPIVAFPDRDDPRDVLVSRHGLPLDRLPPDPVVGTSSRRREAQVRALRPDARIVSLRGNIDTRLRKAKGEDLDAIVLAAAGLRRMGWDARVTEFFPVERLVPAPAQGALAVQARAGSDAAALLAAIDDRRVSHPVRIERAYLAALGAGCTVPAGAFARDEAGPTCLLAMLASPDGERIVTVEERLDDGRETAHAAEIGQRLLAEVGVETASRSWGGWRDDHGDLHGARVVVTRPREQAGALIRELAARGARVVAFPTIRIAPAADPSALDAALGEAAAGGFAWIVFTSVNAVAAVAARLRTLGLGPEWAGCGAIAAVGPATAAAAARQGWNVDVVSGEATADGLADELAGKLRAGARVLYPRSAIGRETIPDALRRAGAEVVAVPAYETIAEPDGDPEVLAQVRRRDYDVVTFASPSGVRQFVEKVGAPLNGRHGTPAVCVGPTSARAAEEAGFVVVGVADDPGPAGIADAVAAYWRRVRNRDELSGHERSTSEPMAKRRAG